MDHVAIMRKSWGLTQKILSGEKVIESRWYQYRYRPWDGVQAGDTVYFKDSGEPVGVKASVARVLQFADLTPSKVLELLKQYGDADGIDAAALPEYYERFKNKRYCILVFLTGPQQVVPFQINKSGFGSQAAWLTVEQIDTIKLATKV